MAAPSYFGSASNPADNGSANEPTTLAVTPPASMQAGDLVFFFGQHDSGFVNITQNNLGGQSWTEVAVSSSSFTGWWCQFNGTWTANPSLDFAAVGGTHATTAVMHVFRPSSASVTWEVTTGGSNVPSGFTTTINIVGGTPGADDSVTLIAMYLTGAAGTFSSIGGGSGGTFASAGTAQYRNTAGGDQSMGFGYMCKGTASANGNMTGTASNSGSYVRFIMAAVPAGTLTPLTLTETIIYTDTLIKQAGKSLADTITFTDTLTRLGTFLRTLTETVTYTDALTKLTGKIFTETTTFTDALTTARILFKELTETITYTDTLIRQTAKNLIETITHSDTLNKLTSKFFSETTTFTDTLLKTPDKVLSESVTYSDTLIRQTDKNLTETTTYTGTLNKHTATTKTETITFTDSLLKHIGKFFTEEITWSDVLDTIHNTAGVLYELVLTETIAFTDTLSKAISAVKEETITYTDTLSRLTSKVYTETISIVEALIRDTSKVLGETVTFTDVLETVFTAATTAAKNLYSGGISAAKRMMRGIGF